MRADVRLGGLSAPDIPIQIIEDGPREQPGGCAGSDLLPTANGTLGVGPHLLDCQDACEQIATASGVFGLHEGSRVPVRGAVAPAFRVPNPVSRFPGHGMASSSTGLRDVLGRSSVDPHVPLAVNRALDGEELPGKFEGTVTGDVDALVARQDVLQRPGFGF